MYSNRDKKTVFYSFFCFTCLGRHVGRNTSLSAGSKRPEPAHMLVLTFLNKLTKKYAQSNAQHETPRNENAADARGLCV